MKFVGYFWLCMLIAIVIYFLFVNYMMRNHFNYYNAIPQHIMEKYEKEKK